ncbi:MAG: hypothetical protein U0797_31755 [Gemmataceae bacterium]
MTLAERLSEYVRACFSGIWVQSFEHDDAIAEIAGLCRRQGWSLATWDVDRGLSVAGRGDGADAAVAAPDPLAAIKTAGSLAAPDGTALLVLRNFHRFLGRRRGRAGPGHGRRGQQANPHDPRRPGAPLVQLPAELEHAQFVVIEHELPGREQLQRIAGGVATEPGELPEGGELDAVSTRPRA